MNGFVMKAKLYNKMKEKAQPFDYNAYKEEQVQAKMDKEMKKDKIVNKNVKAKINEKLVDGMARSNAAGKDNLSTKARNSILTDDRFKGLKEDGDFERDEEHEDFLLRNPSAANKLKKKGTNK